jgi:exodeoxyribonuclease VII small subunit
MPKQSFESALKRLEKIVEELESGDLSLENALKKFEEGVQLSKFCTQKLDETEKKVQILLKSKDGALLEHPFSIENSGNDDQ